MKDLLFLLFLLTLGIGFLLLLIFAAIFVVRFVYCGIRELIQPGWLETRGKAYAERHRPKHMPFSSLWRIGPDDKDVFGNYIDPELHKRFHEEDL